MGNTKGQRSFNSVSNIIKRHCHICLYCHDNEHSRYTDQQYFGEGSLSTPKIAKATHNPFAALAGLMKKED
jgi:hypothetical protein